MTYSGNFYDDDAKQGQQDDFLNRDLAIAEQNSQVSTSKENSAEKYADQQQQDDEFEQDLNNAEEMSDRDNTKYYTRSQEGELLEEEFPPEPNPDYGYEELHR